MFESEMAFLNKKLPTFEAKWEVRGMGVVSQLVSKLMTRKEAEGVLDNLGDSLKAKAGADFPKVACIKDTQFSNGSRVVVFISELRRIFSGEIDGGGGGGGRGVKPLQTTMRR